MMVRLRVKSQKLNLAKQMKSLLLTILIVGVLTGLLLGGAKWWTSDSEVQVSTTSVLDIVTLRSEAAIKSAEQVLTPVETITPTSELAKIPLSIGVVDEPTQLQPGMPNYSPTDGIPDFYVGPPPKQPIVSARVPSAPEPSPVPVVEEPNPSNRMDVVNRWIRRDGVVFLRVEAPDLGVGELELSCINNNVVLWGSHTGLIELRQIMLEFPFSGTKALISPNTPASADAIQRMKADNYIYVEFQGVQFKSPIYEITLADFTASTETLLRTCK